MIVSTPPPLALGFASLATLGWLGAAAAPILIHLWMRQAHRETAWAAVRFLRAALEKQARRLRLRHWLLLAVRTLLLVLIALAAAKPYLDGGPFSAGAATLRVLVIDASMSMRARASDGVSAFDRAQRGAVALIDSAAPGDLHAVLAMGADAGAPAARPTSDAGIARRAVESLTPSYGVADVAAAVAAVERTLGAQPSDRRTEVVFFTDLGANSWNAVADERGAAALAGLAESANVSAVDVSGSTLPSVAVTEVSIASGPPTLAAPVEVHAEATLFAGESGERVAELLVDGAAVAQQTVRLAPGAATPIDFSLPLDRPGPRGVAVRIASPNSDGDRLTEDDTRHLGVTVRSRARVLCVAGAPGACDYLAAALDPTGEGAFEPVVVSDADLPSLDLEGFVAVFLSNVREVSAEEATRLRAYADRGGGVGLFLGDRVSPDRYNESFAPPEESPADAVGGNELHGELRLVSSGAPDDVRPVPTEWILPGRLSAATAVADARIDPLDYAHPVAAPFRGQQRAGLLTTPVSRLIPLAVRPGPGVEVALALEGGAPLLVTASVGRGRSAVLTTGASLDSIDPATGEPWTALPAWPSFLPIVRGLAAHLTSGSDAAGTPLVGDAIDGSAAADGGEYEVRGPGIDGPSTIVSPDAEGAWSFGPVRAVGVYLVGPAGATPTGAVAVNTDPLESDPAQVAPERLPESLRVVREAPSGASGDGAATAASPIHRWLLYAALALALVEPAMACAFGRGQ